MFRSFCTLFCFIFLLKSAAAQQLAYPQGYFRNPLGIPILLAGNFGECRPGHFHSGMDIKTGGHENEPVYAAADGYISRIKMEPGGFGHGLYITHPNGYTTLYAHLNDFAPAIQRYVRQQQYAQESWTVDLQLSPQQFPVKKGEQIAWSGNTGGSTAPHLHFEIRDTKTEHPLNGQLFGFDIRDTRPPVPTELAVYKSSMSPRGYSLHKNGRYFELAYPNKSDAPIYLTDSSGLGIVANDYMNGSDNTLAFYTAAWYVDNVLQGSIRLDDIGYDETRYVNAYADYREQQGGQPLVQRLYRLKGNRLYRIYPGLNQKGGRLILPDTAVHLVRVILTDVYGNSSELRFKAQRYFKDELAKENDQPFVDNPLPWLAAGKMNTISYSNMAFKLDETALYEDAPLWIGTSPADSGSVSLQFQIGNPDIPVHHNFELRLKPNRLIPFSLRTKVVMMYRAIRRENGRAATPEAEGWYQASVRELGKYRLVIDTTTPLVKPIAPIKGSLAKAVIIAFRATDNYTSVKSFRGELDRHWILFEQHGDVWTYVFDGHCRKGAHKLVIKAVDENGNEAAASYTFTR